MYTADYSKWLQSPKALWIGQADRGKTVAGLMDLLPAPFELVRLTPEEFTSDYRLVGIQVVMLDFQDEDEAWLPGILDRLSGNEELDVLALTSRSMRALPRGISDYAVLRKLDVWSLERLLSLAVVRRTLSLNDSGYEKDALTGVLPRSMLSKRLSQLFAEEPSAERPLAFTLIDIDNLTLINESSSDEVGDRVLVRMAQALDRGMLPRDTVLRVDGGTFAVLCPRIDGSISVFKVVDKIQALLAPVLDMPELAMPLTYSMGVALFPDADLKGPRLAHAARLALAQAKRQRGISCRYFTRGMEQNQVRQQSMETSLRRALRREEFVLRYQPQIDAQDGSVKRVEALVRWQHTNGQLVGPKEFLKVAEQTGLLVGLGHWAMHQVCEDLAELDDVPVVVNVGHSQVTDPSFVDTSLRIVANSKMSLDRVGFEINEQTLQASPDEMGRRIQQLTDSGMAFGLDNFGQGHSSLMSLEYLPLSWIKIDRAFFGRFEQNQARNNITRAMLGLAQQFGFEAVAKGVESSDELQFVQSLGFDQVQGFLFGQALDLPELQAYVRQPSLNRLQSMYGNELTKQAL